MTAHSAEDQSRMQRRRRSHLVRRFGLVAVLVFVVAVMIGGGYYVWRMRQAESERPPAQLVVIAESQLEDGTKVAGAVAVLTPGDTDITVEPVDTLAPAAIPGSSYDRLRDALSLGGPDLVAQLAAASDSEVGWLLLDEGAWEGIVDETGGIRIELKGGTTVFTGDKLFRFVQGDQKLSGEKAAALLRGSETLSGKGSGAAAREELARAITEAVLADPQVTVATVREGQAESSSGPEALSAFLVNADR